MKTVISLLFLQLLSAFAATPFNKAITKRRRSSNLLSSPKTSQTQISRKLADEDYVQMKELAKTHLSDKKWLKTDDDETQTISVIKVIGETQVPFFSIRLRVNEDGNKNSKYYIFSNKPASQEDQTFKAFNGDFLIVQAKINENTIEHVDKLFKKVEEGFDRIYEQQRPVVKPIVLVDLVEEFLKTKPKLKYKLQKQYTNDQVVVFSVGIENAKVPQFKGIAFKLNESLVKLEITGKDKKSDFYASQKSIGNWKNSLFQQLAKVLEGNSEFSTDIGSLLTLYEEKMNQKCEKGKLTFEKFDETQTYRSAVYKTDPNLKSDKKCPIEGFRFIFCTHELRESVSMLVKADGDFESENYLQLTAENFKEVIQSTASDTYDLAAKIQAGKATSKRMFTLNLEELKGVIEKVFGKAENAELTPLEEETPTEEPKQVATIKMPAKSGISVSIFQTSTDYQVIIVRAANIDKRIKETSYEVICPVTNGFDFAPILTEELKKFKDTLG